MKDAVTRTEIADLVLARLEAEAKRMRTEFGMVGRIGSTWIDDLLPTDLAREMYSSFPSADQMMLKRSIKEHKLVAAQMDRYDSSLEEAVYAFQDPRIVAVIEQITGLQSLEPDTELYAGGISLMTRGGYLRPHLDNSHDGAQDRYRVLNLLYYVTPGWSEVDGGSLQLWDQGPLMTPRTIESRFNRLVLMVTNRSSWHSVNEIRREGKRCCVSNYYFSSVSPEERNYFHATSFRAETPGLSDLTMRADNRLRTAVLRGLRGAYKNPHRYRKHGSATSAVNARVCDCPCETE